MNSFKIIVSRLVRKLAMAFLIGVLALLACSLWVFVRDRADFEERLANLIEENRRQLTEVRGQVVELRRSLSEKNTEVETQTRRANQADQVLKKLHEFDPGLIDHVFGNADEKKRHQDQLARMESIRVDAQTKVVELQRGIVADEMKLAEASSRLELLDKEKFDLRNDEYAAGHYVRSAWGEWRWWVGAVVLLYLFGGFLAALLLYYGFGAWVSRSEAMQLAQEGVVVPVVNESSLSAQGALWPGEVLRVRRNFLQSADEGLKRRRCLVLNWRRAFSCLASGLTNMIELRNERSSGDRRVTFACTTDPFAELMIVSVPDAGSYVLRAGFLMGIISSSNEPVAVRRHLRLFHWQSWVSGRFGYWEFSGPCRIIVSCVSRLRAESLSADSEGKAQTRRAAQAGVVGFSPQLALKPVRCVGFWRYYRQGRPLFEVEISGVGVFLSSESDGRVESRMRGNEGPVVKLLKIIGL